MVSLQQLRNVLVQGFGNALNVSLLLPLYLCSLLMGLAQTWPLFSAARQGALTSPFLNNLARDQWDALVNLSIARPDVVAPAAASWVFILPLLSLLFGLAYNFFSGGILSVWAGSRSFWAGCRRTFWTFTGLGLLLILLAGFCVAMMIVLQNMLGATVAFVGALVLLQVLNLIGEYARAIAVVQDRRNPLVITGRALIFCTRQAGGVLALAVPGLLLHIGVLLLYRLIANDLESPAVIIAQQGLILAWLWVKLLRLAWAVSYVGVVRAGQARAVPGTFA